MELLFWLALAFVFYAYLGYPLVLSFLSVVRNRPIIKGNIVPTVSFIITALNEEKRIIDKIENTLAQTYPKDRLEIIVASDCSTDGTDAIVKTYEAAGVKLVRAPERKGKEAAQKHAIQAASGHILVFSDVATILPPNGISTIVRNFNDPTVGCVSSVDRFINSDGKVSGEGAYVKYEMMLRSLETKANTLVGLSGSFFAARREVCQDWAIDLQSDFNTVLNAVKLGLRGVSDQDSVGYYKNLADERKEFDRKVRTIVRGISVFMRSLFLLNIFRYGLFSWQLVSHKLCRWLVPFALIACFIANVLLCFHSSFYRYTLICQIVFYGVAALAVLLNLSSLKLLKVQTFFVLVNLSILQAWYRYLEGDRIVGWEPSKRETLKALKP